MDIVKFSENAQYWFNLANFSINKKTFDILNIKNISLVDLEEKITIKEEWNKLLFDFNWNNIAYIRFKWWLKEKILLDNFVTSNFKWECIPYPLDDIYEKYISKNLKKKWLWIIVLKKFIKFVNNNYKNVKVIVYATNHITNNFYKKACEKLLEEWIIKDFSDWKIILK